MVVFTFLIFGKIRKLSGSPPQNAPSIFQGGIVNAASFTGGAIAPEELVAIFGNNLGPNSLQIAPAPNNSLQPVLGNVQVLFNGTPAAIQAVTSGQINAFVPYEIAGSQTVSVVVDIDGVRSQPVTVQVAASAFALVSSNGSGSGEGAILNQDGSINSPANPAARGSVISLYGTGEGVISPALPDGALVLSTPFSMPVAPVSVSIGSQSASVMYAGSAPFLAAGISQINAVIPANAPTGNVPVSVTVGNSTMTQQITVAVK